MQGKNYQSTSKQNPNYTHLSKTPQLQSKTYSFKDPLFESFGNGYLSRAHLPSRSNNPKHSIHPQINNQDNKEVLQEVLQMAQRFALMKTMLKITKPIFSPSVLLVNTQNKTKTEMIIEAKSRNKDQDSQKMCENAKKYLKFIEILKDEQLKYPFEHKTTQQRDNEVKINLESRIQNRTLPFSNQSYYGTNTNPYSKNFSSKDQESQSFYQQKPSMKNEIQVDHSFANDSFPYSKQSQFISQNNGSFTHQDHSKYFLSYQKESHDTYASLNTDQMFQRIQTPKIYQDPSNQKPYFTPYQESNPSKSINKNSKLEPNKFRKFEKQPESSAVQNTQNKKQDSNYIQRENIHNQKMNKEFRIQSNVYERRSNEARRQLSRSSSSKSQILISQNKRKQSQKLNSNGRIQKIVIGKGAKKDEVSRNLAFKVLDKTSQFQKMLKMASSRMNPA